MFRTSFPVNTFKIKFGLFTISISNLIAINVHNMTNSAFAIKNNRGTEWMGTLEACGVMESRVNAGNIQKYIRKDLDVSLNISVFA